MNLSGLQRKKLLEALNDGFRDKASLERMLAFELDKNLDAIAGGNSLQDIVFNLIKTAEAQGWVEDLIRAARNSNPGNTRLRDVAKELERKQTGDEIPQKPNNQQQKILVVSAAIVVVFVLIAYRTSNRLTTKPPILLPSPTNSTNPSKPEQPTYKQPANDLSSEKSVDYTRLRNLLAAKNWREADYETFFVMLKVVGRMEGGSITDEELSNFPCTHLRTIDNIWVEYSNGRFGFSVQTKIYLEVGGKPNSERSPEAWNMFAYRVGWRVKQYWVPYDNMKWDTTAPSGHLPKYTSQQLTDKYEYLFSRMEACKL